MKKCKISSIVDLLTHYTWTKSGPVNVLNNILNISNATFNFGKSLCYVNLLSLYESIANIFTIYSVVYLYRCIRISIKSNTTKLSWVKQN